MSLPEELRIFLLEAYEKLDQVEQDLLSLERVPSDKELLNSVFRAVHTIKSNSGFLGFSNLEGLCHRGETFLDRLRNGQASFNPEVATVLLNLNDSIRETLKQVEEDGEEGSHDYSSVMGKLNTLLQGNA